MLQIVVHGSSKQISFFYCPAIKSNIFTAPHCSTQVADFLDFLIGHKINIGLIVGPTPWAQDYT
jgi:hypothetical protein